MKHYGYLSRHDSIKLKEKADSLGVSEYALVTFALKDVIQPSKTVVIEKHPNRRKRTWRELWEAGANIP